MMHSDIKTCLDTLSRDRRQNHVTDLRVVLDLMKQRSPVLHRAHFVFARDLLEDEKYADLRAILAAGPAVMACDEALRDTALFLLDCLLWETDAPRSRHFPNLGLPMNDNPGTAIRYRS